MEWDENQTFPIDVLKKLGELGFLGVLVPDRIWRRRPWLHGIRHDCRRAFASRWLDRHFRCGSQFAVHRAHFQSGNEDQRRRFVVPLAKGEKIGAWSLTEPEAGSDAGGTQTVAPTGRQSIGF